MPIIEMHLLEGRTAAQKNRVAAAVTEAVSSSLGVDPQTVRILITEHDGDGFYVAGLSPKMRRELSQRADAAEQAP